MRILYLYSQQHFFRFCYGKLTDKSLFEMGIETSKLSSFVHYVTLFPSYITTQHCMWFG